MSRPLSAGLGSATLTHPGTSPAGEARLLPGPSRPPFAGPLALLLLSFALSTPAATASHSPRTTLPLNGPWWFQTNNAQADHWNKIQIPCSFEAHEGTGFDGVGWYQRSVTPPRVESGHRLLLHFEASATETEVWWNGHRLGRHLGGWTPFRFDVTDLVRSTPKDRPHEIRVRVDEKVGHNTQGFLPIVQPHFGGLWQDVQLLVVPAISIDDLSLHARGDPGQSALELEFNLLQPPPGDGPGGARPPPSSAGLRRTGRRTQDRINAAADTPPELPRITVRHRPPGSRHWTTTSVTPVAQPAPAAGLPTPDGLQATPVRCAVPIPHPRLWSPAQPNLYEVEIELDGTATSPGDVVRTRAAFRTIETQGHQLLLNRQPLNVRGLLNWGYYPASERAGPAGGEPGGQGSELGVRRPELGARSSELGREFDAQSSTLDPRRSGSFADLSPNPGERLFRSDFKMARDRGFNLMKFCLWIPPRRCLELADEAGMLVWMEYPTWHPQLTAGHLEDLRREFTEFFLRDRNHPSVIVRSLTCETGPSADLAVVRSLYDLAHALIPGSVIEDDSSWIGWNRVSDIWDDHPYGNNHTWGQTLHDLTRHIAQREPKPLLLGEAIAADTWVNPRSFLPPLTPDAQSSTTNSTLNPQPNRAPYWFPGAVAAQQDWLQLLQQAGNPVDPHQLEADSLRYGLLMRKYQAETFRREVPHGGYVISVIRDFPTASMGLLDYLGRPKWRPADWSWQRDTALVLQTPADARSVTGGVPLSATIGLSHFGSTPLPPGQLTVRLLLQEASPRFIPLRIPTPAITPGQLLRLPIPRLDVPPVQRPTPVTLEATLRTRKLTAVNSWPLWIFPSADTNPPATITVATRFDDRVIESLEGGARVLLLPDGERGSFPLADHWFLRGAPATPRHPLTTAGERRSTDPEPPGRLRQALVDLQHFDLAGPVIPNIPYLDQIDPILLLWDTHDLRSLKTHALVFETRIGPGRLFVSALRHQGPDNAAGRWFLARFQEHLAHGPAPRHELRPELWQALKEKLHADTLDLTERTWQFRPDPQGQGVEHGWAKSELPEESGWAKIKVGAHWEGQGHPALDHWAWYRLRVDIPAAWTNRPVYLTFHGVDDMYELYVNGKFVSRRGDIEKRIDSFNEVFSHRLDPWVRPGEPAVIAVRVYDWYGGGGIFRPVTLGNAAHDPATEILK